MLERHLGYSASLGWIYNVNHLLTNVRLIERVNN